MLSALSLGLLKSLLSRGRRFPLCLAVAWAAHLLRASVKAPSI